MCYVIEFIDNFKYGQRVKITVKTLSHVNVKKLNVWVTAQYDYMGIAVDQWDETRPFKISVPFGKDEIPKILSEHYELLPLKCKKSDPDYVSTQQCNVDYFISDNFLPCNHKVKGQFNFHILNCLNTTTIFG